MKTQDQIRSHIRQYYLTNLQLLNERERAAAYAWHELYLPTYLTACELQLAHARAVVFSLECQLAFDEFIVGLPAKGNGPADNGLDNLDDVPF